MFKSNSNVVVVNDANLKKINLARLYSELGMLAKLRSLAKQMIQLEQILVPQASGEGSETSYRDIVEYSYKLTKTISIKLEAKAKEVASAERYLEEVYRKNKKVANKPTTEKVPTSSNPAMTANSSTPVGISSGSLNVELS